MNKDVHIIEDNTQDNMIIYREDFNKLYDITDSVLDTQYNKDEQRWVAAKALQDALDEAVDNNSEYLIFTPEEVACISSLCAGY